MERTLGLMCGAGVLPARMAREARQQGWRVVALTFGDAPGVDAEAAATIPSRITAIGDVLATLAAERVTAALFAGKFWLGDVLRASSDADPAALAVATRAGTLSDHRLAGAVVATLAGLGIEVLDQRDFLRNGMEAGGRWTAREPDAAEWADVRSAARLARRCADAGIGQTVVVKRGVVAAVEALEGTTEAVRRGAALAGPGAVAVKAVARDNDYRFDTPTVGAETVRAAVDGGIAVLAVEAHRVLLLERDAMVELANRGGLAIVSIDDVDVSG